MAVTTNWLSVEDVIALIDSLQLVTHAEWEAMYDPWPAIVHGTGSAGTTATTVSEVAG